MLTTITIGIALGLVCQTYAAFDCEDTKQLACSGSNSGGGCCKECIAQIVEDSNRIKGWETNFKMQNPTMTQMQVDKYESPDRLDWGHPNLKNCFYCAGQCWNNAEDNLSCQVSQENPFGSKRGVKDVKVTKVMRNPDYERHYPQLAIANKTGIELLELVKRGVSSVEAACGAAEKDKLVLIIPGFGKRYQCDTACLNQFGSRAPTPMPTPHPSQIGEDFNPTPQATFDNGGTPSPISDVGVVPGVKTTPRPNVVVIGGTPVPAANNMAGQSGVACSAEGAQCGMAGSTKLFCKCKVCGFKGDKCAPAAANSLSLVAAAVATLAVAARFL